MLKMAFCKNYLKENVNIQFHFLKRFLVDFINEKKVYCSTYYELTFMSSNGLLFLYMLSTLSRFFPYQPQIGPLTGLHLKNLVLCSSSVNQLCTVMSSKRAIHKIFPPPSYFCSVLLQEPDSFSVHYHLPMQCLGSGDGH